MTTNCTAPVKGHDTGSDAERDCPLHGNAGQRRASLAGGAMPQPSEGQPAPELDDLSDDEWAGVVHYAFHTLDSDGCVVDIDDLEWAKDEIEEQDKRFGGNRDGRDDTSREQFDELRAAGQTVFHRHHFTFPIEHRDLDSLVLSDCHFDGDLLLGWRTVVSEGWVDGDIVDPSTTSNGGACTAILDGTRASGSARICGTSDIAATRLDVEKDIEVWGGNGLQHAALRDPSALGIIIVDDAEAVSVSNWYDDTNVFALMGSEKDIKANPDGKHGGMRFSDASFFDDDEEGERPTKIFSFDDEPGLADARVPEDWYALQAPVIAKARAWRAEQGERSRF